MAKILEVNEKNVWFEQAGHREKANYSFWRGEQASFYPNDDSLIEQSAIVDHIAKGVMPQAPIIGPDTAVVAFGSCFASHIRTYLSDLNFNVLTRSGRAYISKFGDGMVNTFAIRQQFEWAWLGREPKVELWHGADKTALGYDEDVRRRTLKMFNAAEIFIITLGLSELWYDEPTGEVFWRAPPLQYFDPERHKFRMSTHAETVENLKQIHAMIRAHRPAATIVFTVSPIPLTATFRPMSCIVADSASKALLRAAVNEFIGAGWDPNLFYFPSYEVVTRIFQRPYMEERRHVHKHVLEFNMQLFEHYYCKTGMTDADLLAKFNAARELDQRVVSEGHWAVPRMNVGHHPSPVS